MAARIPASESRPLMRCTRIPERSTRRRKSASVYSDTTTRSGERARSRSISARRNRTAAGGTRPTILEVPASSAAAVAATSRSTGTSATRIAAAVRFMDAMRRGTASNAEIAEGAERRNRRARRRFIVAPSSAFSARSALRPFPAAGPQRRTRLGGPLPRRRLRRARGTWARPTRRCGNLRARRRDPPREEARPAGRDRRRGRRRTRRGPAGPRTSSGRVARRRSSPPRARGWGGPTAGRADGGRSGPSAPRGTGGCPPGTGRRRRRPRSPPRGPRPGRRPSRPRTRRSGTDREWAPRGAARRRRGPGPRAARGGPRAWPRGRTTRSRSSASRRPPRLPAAGGRGGSRHCPCRCSRRGGPSRPRGPRLEAQAGPHDPAERRIAQDFLIAPVQEVFSDRERLQPMPETRPGPRVEPDVPVVHQQAQTREVAVGVPAHRDEVGAEPHTAAREAPAEAGLMLRPPQQRPADGHDGIELVGADEDGSVEEGVRGGKPDRVGGRGLDGQLHPAGPRVAEVDVAALERREVDDVEGHLVQVTVVEGGGLAPQAAAQEPLLDAEVEGAAPLRLQVRVALGEERDPEGLEEARLLDPRPRARPQRGGVRAAAQPPRDRGPRNGPRAEAGVALHAGAGGDEETVGHDQTVLRIRAHVGVARREQRLRPRPERSRLPLEIDARGEQVARAGPAFDLITEGEPPG